MLFEAVATLALEHRSKTKRYRNEKSFKRWGVILNKYLLPSLAKVDIAAIDTDTIVNVLLPIWETHNPTARVARMILEYIIGFAIRRHLRPANDFNPAKWKDSLAFDLPAPSEVHKEKSHEAMTVGEAQRLMPKLVKGRIGLKCLAFGILTALRATEFRCARWTEIDFDERIFYVPPERCKVRRTEPFPVPLSQQAIDLLKSIYHTSDEGFVFTATDETAISYQSLSENLKRHLPKHRSATTHGCRSTFSTWCSDTGKPSVVRESCLMHVEANKTSRVYNRSEMLTLRRALMQEWADAIYHA